MIGGVEVLLAIAKSSHWWDTIFHGLGSNLLIGAGMHFGWLLWCAAVEKDFHPGKVGFHGSRLKGLVSTVKELLMTDYQIASFRSRTDLPNFAEFSAEGIPDIYWDSRK